MNNIYILTVDDYIENYQLGNSNTLADNQNLYLASAITGSKSINSKYDSATDSFIEPIKITNLSAPFLIDETDIGNPIKYFTDFLPVTLSFNKNITTDSILPSTVISNFKTDISEEILISELETNNNILQFKLDPSSSANIDWENISDTQLTAIELRVDLGKLEFDSPNNRPASSYFPYKTTLEYSKSVV